MGANIPVCQSGTERTFSKKLKPVSNSCSHRLVGSPYVLIRVPSICSTEVLSDRDPSRFDLDAKTVQRRRTLFWEIFSSENLYVGEPPCQLVSRSYPYLQCLALGRPPSIRVSYVDCQYPADDEDQADASIGCKSPACHHSFSH